MKSAAEYTGWKHAKSIDKNTPELYKAGLIPAAIILKRNFMVFQRNCQSRKLRLSFAAVLLFCFCTPQPIAAAENPAAPPAANTGSGVLTGNADSGKLLFRRRCASCHYANQDKNKIGPPLRSVFNCIAGQVSNYHYSAAMQTAGAEKLRWTAENLRAFLKSPRRLVPGTRMPPVLPRLSPEETENIIRYLAEISAADARN